MEIKTEEMIMSRLAIINYVLQFFFIRLAKCGDNVNGEFVFTHYAVMYWILPLTGWFNNYVVLSKGIKLKRI